MRRSVKPAGNDEQMTTRDDPRDFNYALARVANLSLVKGRRPRACFSPRLSYLRGNEA
jgi:hypothetical protein